MLVQRLFASIGRKKKGPFATKCNIGACGNHLRIAAVLRTPLELNGETGVLQLTYPYLATFREWMTLFFAEVGCLKKRVTPTLASLPIRIRLS